MSIALHIDGDEFRSLRLEAGCRLVSRRCPAIYVALSHGRPERRLLDRAGIPYVTTDENLLVIGSPAIELARSLKIPCLSPFEEGRLPISDPIARQMASAMIASVLPRNNIQRPRCLLAVPGLSTGHHLELLNSVESQALPEVGRRHEPPVETPLVLKQFVKLHGYRAELVPTAYAAGLAELGGDRLTGVSVYLGAETCEASLLVLGREVEQVVFDQGERTLLDRWAKQSGRYLWDFEGYRYLHRLAARDWTRQAAPLLRPASDEPSRIWRFLIAELLAEFLTRAAHAMSLTSHRLQLRQPIPLVCSGAFSAQPGFDALWQEACREVSWPFAVSTSRLGRDTTYVVERGLLIHAESLGAVNTPRGRAA